jgi:hypothetical protein
MCEKSLCHIEDIATDITVNSAIDDLLAGRQILEATGIQDHYKSALERTGLDEWPEGVLRLEVLYAKFRSKLRQDNQPKPKRKGKR